jgi:signal transduction histidine kinase
VPSSEIVLLWLNDWPSHLGDAVEVQVRDNVAGIHQEIMDKLFQPYFTAKPTGESAGLGLSISYELVTAQHRGAIRVDSRLGEFTPFTVRLPRGLAAAPAIEAETGVES